MRRFDKIKPFRPKKNNRVVFKSQRPVNPKRFPEINETFNIHSWHFCFIQQRVPAAVGRPQGDRAAGGGGPERRFDGTALEAHITQCKPRVHNFHHSSQTRAVSAGIQNFLCVPFRRREKRFIVVMMLSLTGAKRPCLCDDIFIFKYIQLDF